MDDIDRRIEADRVNSNTEIEKIRKLLNDSIAASDKRQAMLDERFNELSKQIGGISNSNGEFAEEYFENVYCRDMTFAGMHFHEIIKRKRFEDRKRKDEFDIIMLNEKNAVIVESKYKAKESDIDKVIKKASSFRYWYPEHKNHKIYLCLASLRFEDNIIGKARKKGVAIIQQLGDKTEVNDENLIAY